MKLYLMQIFSEISMILQQAFTNKIYQFIGTNKSTTEPLRNPGKHATFETLGCFRSVMRI